MREYLTLAESAAHEAGALLRQHYETELKVDALHDHDIKLDLDVRSQELITKHLLDRCPDHAIYGEEGLTGDQSSEFQWIVDPIDGTVNYYYGIPHFCVSIALRRAGELQVGVIYDPMLDETFSVLKGEPATLNGRPIQTSKRAAMSQAVVTIGFSKTKDAMDAGFKRYKAVSYQVRKTRMLGSAALAMAYIACGRLDAYVEEQISLWDIAAGLLLVEAAGGKTTLTPHPTHEDKHGIISWNGALPYESLSATDPDA
jgi:myo-inositol-1(or 4)-monophosphatase